MNRNQVLQKIEGEGLVAVIRAESPDSALRIAEACAEAGIHALEITFTVPGASRAIESLAARADGMGLLVGAGTVLDPETARIAILSGASFLVSPSLNPETLRMGNRYGIAAIPGAMTVTETLACLEAGADIVKIFPGELFGPAILRAIRGPLPQARLMPTGGVSLDNLAAWLDAGAVAVGVGSQLTAPARMGDYAEVTRIGRRYVEILQAHRRKEDWPSSGR